jgi:hypothetical protein
MATIIETLDGHTFTLDDQGQLTIDRVKLSLTATLALRLYMLRNDVDNRLNRREIEHETQRRAA